MDSTQHLALAGCALALLLTLSSCGKKDPEPDPGQGPQSPQGAILESVQKTVDAANQRTREVEEAAGSATE